MQMNQTRNEAEEQRKVQMAAIDARSHIKALGYENLYFSQKTAMGVYDPFNLYAAAQQRADGHMAMEVGIEKDKTTMQNSIHDVFASANAVKDLDSFNSFMRLLKAEQDEDQQSELKYLQKVGHRATVFGWLYLSLYVLGSLSLILSQYLEP